jgi:hypothetical protein
MEKQRTRKHGKLQFFKTGLTKEIPVFWTLEQGELDKDKTWVVSISFTENFGIDLDVSNLIFESLIDPFVTLKFKTENFECNCVVYDISEFADTNVVDIGSPNLPMSRMKIKKTN